MSTIEFRLTSNKPNISDSNSVFRLLFLENENLQCLIISVRQIVAFYIQSNMYLWPPDAWNLILNLLFALILVSTPELNMHLCLLSGIVGELPALTVHYAGGNVEVKPNREAAVQRTTTMTKISHWAVGIWLVSVCSNTFTLHYSSFEPGCLIVSISSCPIIITEVTEESETSFFITLWDSSEGQEVLSLKLWLSTIAPPYCAPSLMWWSILTPVRHRRGGCHNNNCVPVRLCATEEEIQRLHNSQVAWHLLRTMSGERAGYHPLNAHHREKQQR